MVMISDHFTFKCALDQGWQLHLACLLHFLPDSWPDAIFNLCCTEQSHRYPDPMSSPNGEDNTLLVTKVILSVFNSCLMSPLFPRKMEMEINTSGKDADISEDMIWSENRKFKNWPRCIGEFNMWWTLHLK